MKFNRKQLLAALAALRTWPGKLLGVQSRSRSAPIPPGPPAPTGRTGLWLADWRQVKRVPVFGSVHPTAQRLIIAAQRQEMLTLRYWGGSTPGAVRQVSPILIFQVGGYGPLYLCGYCHERRAERAFRVERVEILHNDNDPICITE